MVALEEAISARSKVNKWKYVLWIFCSLGSTKEDPKEITLSSFQAMLATALMKGMPS